MGFYIQNSFPLPTTGRGSWLLQPGAPSQQPAYNGGLGATTQIFGLTVDPTLLALGVVALLGAVYLFGSGKPKRRARRLRKRISRSQEQLRALSV